jgi:hypothetical protein
MGKINLPFINLIGKDTSTKSWNEEIKIKVKQYRRGMDRVNDLPACFLHHKYYTNQY